MPIVTATNSRIDPFADKSAGALRRHFAYTGPVSYEAGGEALGFNQLGFGTVNEVHGLTISDGTSVYLGWYNRTTDKVLWFDPTSGLEVTPATDLSTFVGQFEAVGR